MNFFIFRDFSEFSEFNSNYFELNSLNIYIYDKNIKCSYNHPWIALI